ncbi:hypothetical protein V5F34_23295 [Xanthobacter autotrophicus]|uniref:hypothetical protein n=1 Tax=Xanthobacter autotrophicus TaxID=280 RepID=UPI0037277A3A
MVSEIGRIEKETRQHKPKGHAIERSEAPGNVDWRLKRKQETPPSVRSLLLVNSHEKFGGLFVGITR